MVKNKMQGKLQPLVTTISWQPFSSSAFTKRSSTYIFIIVVIEQYVLMVNVESVLFKPLFSDVAINQA